MWTLTLLGLLSQPALAGDPSSDEAPEYLLGDIGVRVDLPRGWNMLRWSDWDFKAETTDSSVMVFAWATPYQLDVTEADLPAWGEHAVAKAKELDAKDAKVVASSLGHKGELTIARAEVSFQFPQGAKGTLFWAGIPVDGQTFHLAALSAATRASRAEKELDGLVDRLEIRADAKDLAWGATVEAAGTSSTLPPGWRVPLEVEQPKVNPLLVPLGLEDLTDCWVAIRPHVDGATDVMATCQGGLWLGVVDDYTFDAAELKVRERMFGGAEVAAAEKVVLSDRLGFLYHPDLTGEALFVAAVPYDQGLARTWALGPAAHGEALEADVRALVASTTYSGPHPATATDQAHYWLVDRSLGLLVGIPCGLVGLVLVAGVGGLVVMRRRKNPYADFDPEDE